MKNSNNNQSKGKKDNQLIFVEYEKPTKEGHLITVVDSYHNTLGRIHRSYNGQTKKFDFTAFDHAGKPLYMSSDKVWELKNEFTKNREVLLKEAHERRVEAKAQRMERTEDASKSEKQSSSKSNEKTMESAKQPQESPARLSHYDMDLTGEHAIDEADSREEELENLRENNSERDSLSLDR